MNQAAHRVLRWAFLAAVAIAATVGAMEHRVPFMPAASDEVRQGFVRVMNHGDESGLVEIVAFDDEGAAYGPITLSLSGSQPSTSTRTSLRRAASARACRAASVPEPVTGAWP